MWQRTHPTLVPLLALLLASACDDGPGGSNQGAMLPVEFEAEPTAGTTATSAGQGTTEGGTSGTGVAAAGTASAGAASAGTPSAEAGTGGTAAPSGMLPCGVAEVLQTHCANCHGQTPIGGAPMPLLSREDFLAQGATEASKSSPVHALVRDRINRPFGSPGSMPQGDPMSEAELATLDGWLDSGMPAGDDICEAPSAVDAGTGPEPLTGPGWPGGVKPEETCYQLLKHGVSGDPNDTSPHVMQGSQVETYVNFYYAVPWTEPVVATRWRTIYDKTDILHHWLLYNYRGSKRDGHFETSLGSHVGSDVQLVAGWAVGGGDEDSFPAGVTLRMPPPGAMFMLEWHLYNTTGETVADRSGVEVCVVPESAVERKHVAGLTWVGTEDFGPLRPIPARSESKYNGVCTPGRQPHYPEIDPDADITIVRWLPHMHTIGRHMDTWILRADGSTEHVFSKPFRFDRQITYAQDPPLVMRPGDRIAAECTFHNEGDQAVIFGPSTNQEMCYQFTMAYPAGLLDNPENDPLAPSLAGADNTCISRSGSPLGK